MQKVRKPPQNPVGERVENEKKRKPPQNPVGERVGIAKSEEIAPKPGQRVGRKCKK
jgi:hypothetical protein